MKGIILAGSASGVGKTIATLVATRALTRAGVDVQPAKAGPDFIDPSHHAAVAGKPSRTLDPWLQGEAGLRVNYHHGEGDLCLIEGVMGLYDGDRASTARVAEALDVPVILVIDGSARMESVAAAALGFREYASQASVGIDVVGVIAQRVHGGRHERGIREALPDGLTYFGRIPPLDALRIPERHLGLHLADEAAIDVDVLDAAADHLAVDRLLAAATTARPAPTPETRPVRDCRIAVARDRAFRFIYPAVLERLRARCEVVPFAPVDGEDCPDCDGVYLPGGYPELHAAALAESPALATLAERAQAGHPILGECGGMMALAESLTTTDGSTFPMAGVLPAEIRMHERFQALDHVRLRARRDTLIAAAGSSVPAHEFHYSRADVATDAAFAFEVTRGTGIDGAHDGVIAYNTLGTYSHVHAASGAFDTFIDTIAS